MTIIEQYEYDFSKLRIVSREHGLDASKPVLVGSPESIEFFCRDDVATIECRTGFGSYTLRKRKRGGHLYWFGYRRAGKVIREYSAGKPENITSEILDEIAIKLYE